MFDDEGALQIFDPDFSETEDWFILLGMSAVLRIPVGAAVNRANDEAIRIISARKSIENETSKEYDFGNTVKNPYVKAPKTTITIRLDSATVDYFKSLATEMPMPYQTLINLYLNERALKKVKRHLS